MTAAMADPILFAPAALLPARTAAPTAPPVLTADAKVASELAGALRGVLLYLDDAVEITPTTDLDARERSWAALRDYAASVVEVVTDPGAAAEWRWTLGDHLSDVLATLSCLLGTAPPSKEEPRWYRLHHRELFWRLERAGQGRLLP